MDTFLCGRTVYFLVYLRRRPGLCQSLSAGLRPDQHPYRGGQRRRLYAVRSAPALTCRLCRPKREPLCADSPDPDVRSHAHGNRTAYPVHREKRSSLRHSAGACHPACPAESPPGQCAGHGEHQRRNSPELRHRPCIRVHRLCPHVLFRRAAFSAEGRTGSPAGISPLLSLFSPFRQCLFVSQGSDRQRTKE